MAWGQSTRKKKDKAQEGREAAKGDAYEAHASEFTLTAQSVATIIDG
jgi:hypothetical protein